VRWEMGSEMILSFTVAGTVCERTRNYVATGTISGCPTGGETYWGLCIHPPSNYCSADERPTRNQVNAAVRLSATLTCKKNNQIIYSLRSRFGPLFLLPRKTIAALTTLAS